MRALRHKGHALERLPVSEKMTSARLKGCCSKARWALLPYFLIIAGLTGCASSEADQALINGVVTALPTEIEGCVFLGNVDNDFVSYSIEGARNNLKLKAARLGANHLVETHLAVSPSYSYLWPERMFDDPAFAYAINSQGFFLTGRAYLCHPGQGVKTVRKQGQQQSILPERPQLSPPQQQLVDSTGAAQGTAGNTAAKSEVLHPSLPNTPAAPGTAVPGAAASGTAVPSTAVSSQHN